MKPTMTPSQWLSLDYPIRAKLVEIFNVQRSSGTQVIDSRVVSDGHTYDDLQAINVESMQAYLQTTVEDFYSLLNKVVDQINAELTPEEPESPKIQEGVDVIAKLKELLETPGEVTTTAKELLPNKDKKDASKTKASKQVEGGTPKGSTRSTGSPAKKIGR